LIKWFYLLQDWLRLVSRTTQRDFAWEMKKCCEIFKKGKESVCSSFNDRKLWKNKNKIIENILKIYIKKLVSKNLRLKILHWPLGWIWLVGWWMDGCKTWFKGLLSIVNNKLFTSKCTIFYLKSKQIVKDQLCTMTFLV
jgi:hypothetical protein